jgi:predicted MPP superfamily phosphohydrolase
MKKKVYWIRIEQLQEVYKCMTQDDASIICQEHYQLLEQLPHFTSLSNKKPIIYWIENKECKMTDHLTELDSLEYVQLTLSDITSKSIKGYYIKVEDILELNKTIPFSVIDNHLSSFGLVESVKRVANKNQYFCWMTDEGLLCVKGYKPAKGFVQLTVKDILKLHSQRYENRLQKQKSLRLCNFCYRDES